MSWKESLVPVQSAQLLSHQARLVVYRYWKEVAFGTLSFGRSGQHWQRYRHCWRFLLLFKRPYCTSVCCVTTEGWRDH